jgi:hypothetical protein
MIVSKSQVKFLPLFLSEIYDQPNASERAYERQNPKSRVKRLLRFDSEEYFSFIRRRQRCVELFHKLWLKILSHFTRIQVAVAVETTTSTKRMK